VLSPAPSRDALSQPADELEYEYVEIDSEIIVGVLSHTPTIGLINGGNTCFVNSVLQVLMHTAPLKHYIINKHDHSKCNLFAFDFYTLNIAHTGSALNGGEHCALCEFAQLITSAQAASATGFTRTYPVNMLHKIKGTHIDIFWGLFCSCHAHVHGWAARGCTRIFTIQGTP
jgi:hypothetical protein